MASCQIAWTKSNINYTVKAKYRRNTADKKQVWAKITFNA